MLRSNLETKWINKTDTINVGYDAPSIAVLNSMTQGSANNVRVGDKIKMRSLEIKFQMAARTGNADRVRILIFMDKQTNGAPPAANSIFADGGASAATSFFQPLHPDYFPSRYQLLRDRMVILTQQGGATNVNQEKLITFKIPLKGKLVQYRAGSNTGNIDDIVKGSLIMFCVSDALNAAQPAVAYFATFKFQDA